MKKDAFCLVVVLFFLPFEQCTYKNMFRKEQRASSEISRMVLGTYAGLPRKSDGRVDHARLLEQLRDLHANTYHWLIWQGDHDWEDLQLFLPMAQKNRLWVWVTVVPPSESKPKVKWNSEPFGKDYVRWMEEVAKLSVKYPNLVVFSIDDFVHNLDVYTPAYVQKMVDIKNKINPALKFIPCTYYKQITPRFVQDYQSLLDGLLFPYRAESEGANLQNPRLVESEINTIRTLFNNTKPLYIDVYLTAHSRLGASTSSYVREVIRAGKKYADGVLIFTHPNPVSDREKYQVVKSEFSFPL